MQYKWSGNVNIVMTEAKILTVVIPVYNRADIVGRTLQCLSEQDTRDFALILVDNNSQDDSLNVLQTWKNENTDIDCTIFSEKKPGATAARNCGLRNVTTEYVLFFDSDDVMFPEHLSSIIKSVSDFSHPDIIGWDGLQELAGGKTRTVKFTTRNMVRNHLVLSILSTYRYAAKTELVRRVGGWNEELTIWDDYELGIRLLAANPTMKYRQGKPLVKSFYTAESYTSTHLSDKQEKVEKCLDEVEKTVKKHFENFLPWVDYRRAVLAAFYDLEGDKSNAERLLNEACRSVTPPAIVKTLYHWHHIFGRGAWIIARILFALSGKKC